MAATAVALAVGFLALGLSSWQSVATFGALSAVATLGSGVAALVVLPALAFGAVRVMRTRASAAAALRLALFVSLVALAPSARAATDARPGPGPDREALLERAFRTLFDCDLTAVVSLETSNHRGESIRRVMHLARNRIEGRMHSYARFVAPEWTRDTAVLIVEHAGRDPDLMVYTPELERVRRLSAAQRTDAFFGTDLWYEDLQERHTDDWILGAAQLADGRLRIEAVPRIETSYARAIFTVERERALMLEIELFRRGRDTPFRRVMLDASSAVAGEACLMPTRLTVENADRRTKTHVRFEAVTLAPAFDPAMFRAISLESGRRIPGLQEAR